MAVRSSFFNSVNGDRRYKSNHFAEYFASFIANGIFPNPSNTLQVYEKTNMTVTVKPGKGWINGYFAINEYDYDLTLDNADGILNRIDRIVLRLDFNVRAISIAVKKGVFASTPVAPTLQRDADAHELALADVYVTKGATTVKQSNITDQRLNNALCGVVHGTVSQVDTTTIFNQYSAWFSETTGKTESEINQWQLTVKAEFDQWFASIQNILDGDVAANLAARITTLEQNLATHQAEYAQFKTATEVDSATFKKHMIDYIKHPGVATTTNNGNDYTVTLNPVPTAYVNAMGLIITVNVDSTGPVTINVNGLGAIPVKKADGSSMKSFKKDGVYTLRYSNSAFIAQGEGGDYADSLSENVLYAQKRSGTARQVINKNSRIQTYYEYIQSYNFDIVISGNVSQLSASSDGKVLVVLSNNQIILYRLVNGMYKKQPVLLSDEAYARTIRLSGDGKYLVITYTSGSPYIKAYFLNDDNSLTPLSFDVGIGYQFPSNMKINYDGTIIVVSISPSPNVIVYKRTNNSFIKMALPDIPYSSAYDIAISKDGDTIAVGGGFSPYLYIYKIDTSGNIVKQTAPGASYAVTNVEFSQSDNNKLLHIAINNSSKYITYAKRINRNAVFTNISSATNSASDQLAIVSFNTNYIGILINGYRYYYKIDNAEQLIGIGNRGGYQYLDIFVTNDGTIFYGGTSTEKFNHEFINRSVTNLGYMLTDIYNAVYPSTRINNMEHLGIALNDAKIGQQVDYIGIFGV